MTLQGTALGAELGELYKMGKETLPTAADDYLDAWQHTPGQLSHLTSRGGGLGRDPGKTMDKLLAKMDDAMRITEEALRDVAERLVWTAEEYEGTDQAARDEFKRKREQVDDK